MTSVNRRRTVAAGVALVVVCGGGVSAYAATRPAKSSDVTATVRRGSVTGVVETSGTVSASRTATVTFSASGTVRHVSVTTGQRVRRGEVLARLDTGSLSSAVNSAAATLAEARQKLAADRSGTSTSSSGTQSATSGSSSISSSTATATATTTAATSTAAAGTSPDIVLTAAVTTDPPAGLTAIIAEVRKDQNALSSTQQALQAQRAKAGQAQSTLRTAVQNNTRLRDAMVSDCSSSAPTSTSSSDDDACTTAQNDYAASADTLSQDDAALTSALDAQADDIAAFEKATTTYSAAVDKLTQAAQEAGSSGGGGTVSGSGSTSRAGSSGSGTGASGSTGTATPSSSSTASSGSSSTAGSGSTTSTASAADLLSDEAAIRADRAALRVAKQNRAAATLRSPISGRVGSVGLTAGNDASAGSIVVTGTGAPTVTLAVPLSQVSLVHRGEHATVQVDGKQQAVTGTVSSVGVKADTSSGAATFPVTVQLGNDSASLVDGVGADVTLTVGRAKNVLLLPNSAISAGASGSHTVTVVSGSTTSTAAVTLGVVGEDVTEVLTGLRAGQRVLLADASASLPSSSTSSSTSFGAGGFGGAAGGFAGGFGPPPGR